LSSEVDSTGTSPKSRAIQNAIDNANSTLQWGSTFYNTTLPKITTPGGTGGTITPGTNAGAGSNAGPQFPANSASYTVPQMGQVYKDLQTQGYSDTAMRSAWESKTGKTIDNAGWDLIKAEADKL
jgi:hypothetical protein